MVFVNVNIKPKVIMFPAKVCGEEEFLSGWVKLCHPGIISAGQGIPVRILHREVWRVRSSGKVGISAFVNDQTGPFISSTSSDVGDINKVSTVRVYLDNKRILLSSTKVWLNTAWSKSFR